MESETVSLIREAYRALNEERLNEWAAAHLPADFELIPVAGRLAGERFTGPDGFAEFLADLTEVWETNRVEIDEIVDFGSRVVVLGRLHSRGRESGVDLDVLAAHVWTVDGPALVRLELIGDREEALRRGREG